MKPETKARFLAFVSKIPREPMGTQLTAGPIDEREDEETEITIKITEEMIEWAIKEGACAEGIERARMGWDHMKVGDRRWLTWRTSDPDILDVLACDDDDDVRWGVARNSKTPESTRRLLLSDRAIHVRRAAKTFFDIQRTYGG